MSNDSERASAALAANVRRLRVAARLSLSELARANGVREGTRSAVESGRGNPTVETLAALASALGVPVVDLLAVPEPVPVTVVRAGGGEALAAGVERLGRLGTGELRRVALEARADREQAPLDAGSRLHVVVTRGTLVAG